MYQNIYKTELAQLFRKSEVFIQDRTGSDGELSFIAACYSPANALAGYTDYKDHRKDTLPQVKRMIRECIRTRQCQRGSYYNGEGVPFDSVRVELKHGGWSAYPHWKDGTMDYFTTQREEYANRRKK